MIGSTRRQNVKARLDFRNFHLLNLLAALTRFVDTPECFVRFPVIAASLLLLTFQNYAVVCINSFPAGNVVNRCSYFICVKHVFFLLFFPYYIYLNTSAVHKQRFRLLHVSNTQYFV